MSKNTSSKYLANALKRKKEEAKKKKEAGWKSEAASFVNPLNLLGGSIGGAITAGLTPTQSYDDLARRTARETLKDNLVTMLVPGVGPYQMLKRQGTSIRSPEVQGLKDDYKAEKDKAKNDAKAEKAKAENEKNQSILKETFGEKESGWKSEMIGGFNPVNYVTGGAPGVLAAGLTPTRTMKEQAISDVDTTTANALVPFLGYYNAFKRHGTSIRSPEFLAMVQKHKDLLAEEEAAAAAEGEEKESSLKGNQKKIDINKNNKVDAADLAMLRNQKKVVKGEIVSKEAILYLARNKQADSLRLQELIAKGKDVAGQAVNKVQGAMPSIAMGQMLKNPNVQNALGGAALGAGAGGLSYLLSRDKDKSLGKRLLTGATLGGITGGAYNTAKDYFQGPQSNDFVGPRLPEVDTTYNGNQPVRTIGDKDYQQATPEYRGGGFFPIGTKVDPFVLRNSMEKEARLFGRRRSSGSSSSRGRGGYGVSTGASSRSIRSSSRVT